jgi:hypothetical protein
MPNHISNRLQIKSFDDDWKKDNEAFEKLQGLMKTDNSLFDFNVLIPYPQHWREADDAHDEARKAGIKWSDLPADGYNHGGYEWCIDNWGTKWGAYDIGIDYEEIYFQAAWSTPLPIWREISKRFPDMQVVVEYADEDRGSNCGKLVFVNGKEIERVDMSARPEAELFARAIIAEQQLAAANQEIIDLKAAASKISAHPQPD